MAPHAIDAVHISRHVGSSIQRARTRGIVFSRIFYVLHTHTRTC